MHIVRCKTWCDNYHWIPRQTPMCDSPVAGLGRRRIGHTDRRPPSCRARRRTSWCRVPGTTSSRARTSPPAAAPWTTRRSRAPTARTPASTSGLRSTPWRSVYVLRFPEVVYWLGSQQTGRHALHGRCSLMQLITAKCVLLFPFLTTLDIQH